MQTALVQLFDWVNRHDLATVLPAHLYQAADRQDSAERWRAGGQADETFAEIATDEARAALEKYSSHRAIEKQVADYLNHHRIYPDLARRLRSCRQSGSLGVRHKTDGSIKPVILWDKKCNLNRLCPDESREEQRRLDSRYRQPIIDWKNARPGRRQIQKGVLSPPNVSVESFGYEYKREFYRRLSLWLKDDAQNAIKGCLATMEDPLSWRHDWNLHLNVVLLVDGFFDWKAANESYKKIFLDLFPGYEDEHFQCEFRALKNDEIEDELREVIKYPVKLIPSTADQKKGDSPAPALVEYPPERFTQWWESGFGQTRNSTRTINGRKTDVMYRPSLRRTRTYGLLHSLPAVYWDGCFSRSKRSLLLTRMDLDPLLKDTTWKRLDGETRKLLAAEILPDDEPGTDCIEWIGRVSFTGGTYRVKIDELMTAIGLIPAHKSGGQISARDNSCLNSGHDPPPQYEFDELFW